MRPRGSESGLVTALVLGGGGARGAYEAGVVAWLHETLEPELGRPLRFDVLCGSSVGGLHACWMAATADRPLYQAKALVDLWTGLDLARVLRFDTAQAVRTVAALAGFHLGGGPPGLFDPAGLEHEVLARFPWLRIRANLRAGRVRALAISATHVGSGQPVIFVDAVDPPAWNLAGCRARVVRTRIGPRHALASAAVPVLFPAVRLGGALYSDGSLRLDVPLEPAIRLGAQRVAVVSLRPPRAPPRSLAHDRAEERAFGSAPFLAGKVLDALFVDRLEQDLTRLRQVTALVDEARARLGPDFDGGSRPVRDLVVHPSQDLATIAADYVRSRTFARRNRGAAGRLMRLVAEREARDDADLASYLLFDGEFAGRLIELARRDTAQLRDQWLAFASPEPERARPPRRASRGRGELAR